MGKNAETPIWCARKKYLETSSGSDDLQEVTRLVWSLKAQNMKISSAANFLPLLGLSHVRPIIQFT